MFNSTSKTYTLKRKILNFTNKISEDLLKPERKFTADMTYGMLASGSCLLTDICDRIHEPIKKINVVDRLSRHLDKGIPASAVSAYLRLIKQEKDYKSTNVITFQAMERGAALFGKATFAMDRGYDDNKMFLKLDELRQDYVIRLKSNRKLLFHNKWTTATELCVRRKGKVKTSVFYRRCNPCCKKLFLTPEN